MKFIETYYCKCRNTFVCDKSCKECNEEYKKTCKQVKIGREKSYNLEMCRNKNLA